MIQHASVYDRSAPSEDAGLRVLTMRYWPRGVRRERVDVWLKDAAPSPELLRAYMHEGLTWADFDQRYRAEMREQRPRVLERLRELEREHGRLTLLCHERIPPRDHCHRETLLDLLTPADAPAPCRPGSGRRRGRAQGVLSRRRSRKASP